MHLPNSPELPPKPAPALAEHLSRTPRERLKIIGSFAVTPFLIYAGYKSGDYMPESTENHLEKLFYTLGATTLFMTAWLTDDTRSEKKFYESSEETINQLEGHLRDGQVQEDSLIIRGQATNRAANEAKTQLDELLNAQDGDLSSDIEIEGEEETLLDALTDLDLYRSKINAALDAIPNDRSQDGQDL